LVQLIQRPDDVAVLAPIFERELIYHLLKGPEGPCLPAHAHKGGGRLDAVRRVSAWIAAHPEQEINIPRLASLAHMSVATLHRNFKKVTSLTPLQFQKQIRLLAARRRLLVDSESVSRAAYVVGYTNLSQFAREYRRMFGVSLSEDIAATHPR
jgi:AraC-like DNA-binding protein